MTTIDSRDMAQKSHGQGFKWRAELEAKAEAQMEAEEARGKAQGTRLDDDTAQRTS